MQRRLGVGEELQQPYRMQAGRYLDISAVTISYTGNFYSAASPLFTVLFAKVLQASLTHQSLCKGDYTLLRRSVVWQESSWEGQWGCLLPSELLSLELSPFSPTGKKVKGKRVQPRTVKSDSDVSVMGSLLGATGGRLLLLGCWNFRVRRGKESYILAPEGWKVLQWTWSVINWASS